MTDRQSNRPGLWQRIKMATARFMAGRYGTDQLNSLILWTGVAICLLSMFMPTQGLRLGLTFAAYACMILAIFRSLSKNTYKRYRENRKYLGFLNRIKDRDHKYFDCPRCKQPVRVPKGKGKISITCPKCKEKFIRKS